MKVRFPNSGTRVGVCSANASRQIIQCCFGIIALLMCVNAHADGLNGQRFVPAAGAAGGFMVEQPDVPRHLGFGAGLFINYSLNPLILRDRTTDEIVYQPLQHALSFNLLGSIGLFNFLEIALDLPIHALYVGDAVTLGTATLDASGGIGDFRLIHKIAWWLGGSPELNYYIGFALPISFPSGNEAALRGYGGVTFEPRLLLGMGATRFRVVANVGFRSRVSQMDSDFSGANELTYGLAGTYGLLTGAVPLDLQAEMVGGYLTSASHGGSPLELLAGVIVWPLPELSLYAALGPGITNGLGTPDVRILTGIRYTRKVPGRDRYTDRDGDRVPDYRDDCKDIPEDYDGFEDEDGCMEVDNDNDGILDDNDECPSQAEEPGGDGDGCPDKARIIIRRGRVIIFGKILFKTGEAEPLPKSNDLLDQIAESLRNNQSIKGLRIEGHTDNTGDAAMNLRLSQKRAEKVKEALIIRGMQEERLSTRGFGETRPIAPNDTAAGRARNRRVEFIILR